MKASFLDLDVNIKHSVFESKLYDETDVFTFSIVTMPQWDNNMSTSNWVRDFKLYQNNFFQRGFSEINKHF